MAFIAEVNTTLTKSKIAPMNSVTKDPVAVENVGVVRFRVQKYLNNNNKLYTYRNSNGIRLFFVFVIVYRS